MALRTCLRVVAACSALITVAFTSLAQADTLTYSATGFVSSLTGNGTEVALTPFDPNTGTLNSVTMHVDRHFDAYVNYLWMDDSGPAHMPTGLSTDILPMGLRLFDSIDLFVSYADYLAGNGSRSGSIHESEVYSTTYDLSNFEIPGRMYLRTYYDFPFIITQDWELNGLVNLTYIYDYTPSTTVPEPSTVFLVAAGLVAIIITRKKPDLND